MKLIEELSIIPVDGGAIVLNQDKGVYFQLNATGLRVVEGLRRGTQPPQIVSELATEFGVDAERVGQDVSELCESLRAGGFVRSGS